MKRHRMVWVLAGILLISSGCERRYEPLRSAPAAMDRHSPNPTSAPDSPAPQRFIAEHHDLIITTPESELPKAWEAAVGYCNSTHCEVISSKLTARADDSLPSGSISVRVIPQELAQFLASVQKLGSVAEHTTERDDKTTDVVDTGAKIKNLTAFRDNLRAMLGQPSATVKDLIEIQQQLADTQAELDSAVAQRKILANETEKIAVDISFQIEESRRNSGALGTIRNALSESGSVLAQSFASLITLTVAVVPWLMVLVIVVWILVKLWRRVRRPRNASQAPPPTTRY